MAKKKKKDLIDLIQVNLLTDIFRLSHLVNIETDHRVTFPMSFPDKRFKQFYINLDGIQLGKNRDEHISPVFLKDKDANDLLRQIKYRLIKCLEENKKYRYGAWK